MRPAVAALALLFVSAAISPPLAAKDDDTYQVTLQRKFLLAVGSPQQKAMRETVAAAIAAGDMSNTADQLDPAAGTVRADFTGHGKNEKVAPNLEHPEIGDTLVYRACENGSSRMWLLTQTRDARASKQGWSVQSFEARKVDSCASELDSPPPAKPAP